MPHGPFSILHPIVTHTYLLLHPVPSPVAPPAPLSARPHTAQPPDSRPRPHHSRHADQATIASCSTVLGPEWERMSQSSSRQGSVALAEDIFQLKFGGTWHLPHAQRWKGAEVLALLQCKARNARRFLKRASRI